MAGTILRLGDILVRVTDPKEIVFVVNSIHLVNLGRMLCIVNKKIYLYKLILRSGNTFAFHCIETGKAPPESEIPDLLLTRNATLGTKYK